MEIPEIKKKIDQYNSQGKKIFITSSFQTHSIPMLHILSEIDRTIPVYFINTGYLFPETVSFKDHIARQFNLKIVDLKSSTSKYLQRGSDGKLIYITNPDHCCYLNKTQPVEQVMANHDVWINGVRADQNIVRKAMKIEQAAPYDSIRFHPMLDWNKQKIFSYIRKYDLPKHPLHAKGYDSIGCEPCTRMVDIEIQEREARWFGLNKIECGLHTDLIK